MWLKITTGQTLDSKFVPNSLNVRITAGETGMLSGHWFPPHITSLAGYINYMVNVRHSYAVVSIKSTISLFILILSTCM